MSTAPVPGFASAALNQRSVRRRSKPDRGRERAAPRRSPAPIREWQIPGGGAGRTASSGAPQSRLRSVRFLSGSSVSLHGRRQFLPLCGQHVPSNGRPIQSVVMNTDPVLISSKRRPFLAPS